MTLAECSSRAAGTSVVVQTRKFIGMPIIVKVTSQAVQFHEPIFFVSDVGATVAVICIIAACWATSGGSTLTMSIGSGSARTTCRGG